MKLLNKKYDLLIVGAGPSGCTLAHELASKNNLKILIIDKRNHVAGNCYDYYNSDGILVHKYGPHYFRSNKKKLINYLSKFTRWIPGKYIVKCKINGTLYDFPININTLEKYYNKKLNFKSAKKLLEEISIKKFKNPKNFEEYIKSKIGSSLYKDFFLNYTLKQWDKNPKELSVSVAKRIPIRLNRKTSYVDHKYQLMPKNGFTSLFKNMIKHRNIDLKLKCDYLKLKGGININIPTIYTGPIDTFFKFKFGKLEWRSLKFKFETFNKKFHQNNVQINYPNNYKFTRKVEYKHVTGQKNKKTTISKEYPSEKGEPYYPIPSKGNKNILSKYSKEIRKLKKKNIYFIGRLAEYKYINTDEAIERALELYKELSNNNEFKK